MPNVKMGLRDWARQLIQMTSTQLHESSCKEALMLFTIAVILFVLWLLGVVGTYTIGAFVHVLLVIALVLFVLGLLSGRRTVI
jgi:hypothetical protein